MSLPERIKQRREEYQLTQTELAARIGATQVAVSQFEAGLKTPNVPMLVRLADALNVSTDWLLGRSDTIKIKGGKSDGKNQCRE